MENFMTDIQIIGGFVVFSATVITSLGVVIQAFTKYNPLHPFRKWLLEPVDKRIDELEERFGKKNDEISKKLSSHCSKLDKLTIAKMKSDIMNEGMPISERILLAKEYLQSGHNGDVSVKAKILLEDLEQEQRR